MLDQPPSLWRKKKELPFEEQKKRVTAMKELWEPFDWTKRIKRE